MIPRVRVNYRTGDLLRAAREGSRPPSALRELSRLLADYFGGGEILPTISGRSALYLLLRSLPQSKVLVAAYTCKAVPEAAQLAGKTVHHVDSEADEFNARSKGFADLVDADTIVIATHQYGIPCEIEALAGICRKHSAPLIEDVAGAFGTRIHGKLAGTFGDAAFFSFDSTKLIQVPLKGGFVLSHNPQMFGRLKEEFARHTRPPTQFDSLRKLLAAGVLDRLANPQIYRAFHWLMFQLPGRTTADSAKLARTTTALHTSRMAEWQARIAIPQVERAGALISRRRELYEFYQNELSGLNGVRLPPRDRDQAWACIRFPILVPEPKVRFYQKCCAQGADLAFSFTYLGAPGHCREAHRLAARVLNLPFYDRLEPAEAVRVVRAVRKAAESIP